MISGYRLYPVRRAASFKALPVIILGFGLYRAAGAIKLVCRKFSDQLGRVKITLLSTITAASEVIALWCMLNLWRNRASLIRKMLWTLILLSPIIGPVFYGGMFEPPSIQPGFRSREIRGKKLGTVRS